MIYGFVYDEETNSPLPGANVYLSDAAGNLSYGIGTTSTNSGGFSLSPGTGKYITFSFVGFQRKTIPVSELKYTTTIYLKPQVVGLGEFVVRPKTNHTKNNWQKPVLAIAGIAIVLTIVLILFNIK